LKTEFPGAGINEAQVFLEKGYKKWAKARKGKMLFSF